MKLWKLGWLLLFLGLVSFGGKEVYALESHLFEASFQSFYYDYREELPGSNSESEEGFITPGGHLSYTFLGSKGNLFYFRALAEYNLESESTYENLLDEKGITDNVFGKIEINIGLGLNEENVPEKMGYPFEGLQSSFMYIGVGLTRWERDIGSTSSFSGYDAQYDIWSIPVGIRGFFFAGEDWRGSIDFAISLLIPVELDLDLSQRSSNFRDAKVDIDGAGVDVKLEFTLDYRLVGALFLTGAFEYHFRFIPESETFTFSNAGDRTTFPESEAHIVGVRLGIKLAF